jgi:major membrane immunogen (membrane-anchored lipoprotein)
MSKHLWLILCLLAIYVPGAFAGVTVTTPTNNSTVSGQVNYVASATTSCSKGVGSMGIYTAPGVLAYVGNGKSLNTNLSLAAGTYNTTVEEWDNCGGASTKNVTITVTAQTGVQVASPANNSTVGTPVNFSATATTSCAQGVSSMGIYTSPYQLAYTVNGASLNTNLSLTPGTYNTVVEEWDKCGGASTTPVTITVSSTGGGSSFTSLQKSGGWGAYGQGPPNFVDCSPSPCDGISFWMSQNINSPSMSGSSTEFNVGGTTDYSDALYNNHLIGDLSSQGMPDSNHTLVPTYTKFTYDVYFWGSNLSLSQAVEFDINQFYNSMGFIWGHECRIAGGNEWDVWDNKNSKWVATGIKCNPISNYWNHLTIQVQRNSSNQLVYQSITLNGVTSNLNWTYDHGSVPSSWWGVTINYQMDGNYKQQSYDVYLDDLTFTYQ